MSLEQSVTICIPEGQNPGARLNIPLEDGRIFEIVVPPNTFPGDYVTVVIPDDASGGETVNSQVSSNIDNSRVALGAAAIGGIIATLVVGPVTGAVVAGAALYATTRNDRIGDVARATGKSAIVGYDAAVEFDKKHGIVDKIKSAGAATLQKAKEINNEYKITDIAQEKAQAALVQARALDSQYKITDNATKAVSSGVKTVFATLAGPSTSIDANNCPQVKPTRK